MNIHSFSQKFIQNIIIKICLFPATFFYYRTLDNWLTALLKEKNFLCLIEENINEIIIDSCKKNTFYRIIIGLPLRLARKILLFGFPRALISVLGYKSQFRSISPGLVELIPGLSQHTMEAIQKASNLLRSFPKEKISIAGNAHYFLGESISFSGKKVVIIAHWDPDRIIDPYVIYQCQHFKRLGFKVLLASASKPKEFPQNYTSFIDAIIYRTCDGYDFTSWKAAFELYPSLYQCQELVLTNDSYFGPIGSFMYIHEEMDKIPCDFWGLVRCNLIRPHLQSYYLTIRKKVLQHSAIKEFFDRVTLSNDREIAVSYETCFSLWLSVNNFQPAAFIPVPDNSTLNYTFEYWKELIQEGVPILKREFFLKKEYNNNISSWKSICLQKGYPIHLIDAYLKRRKIEINIY